MRRSPAPPPVLVLLAAACAAGCITVGGGGGPPLEQRSFDLQPPLPEAVPAEAEGPEVLWVEPFTADSALDREEIVWRRGAVESGAYERYRWVRPPAEAVRAILADSLSRAGVCAVAASDPRVQKPDFALRAHLARFEEVDAGAAWTGAVEVRVVLVRARDGEEILRRNYAGTERATSRNPGGVVEALQRAMGPVSAALVEDVRRALRIERGVLPEVPPAAVPVPAPAPVPPPSPEPEPSVER